jgi:hypothetical protein
MARTDCNGWYVGWMDFVVTLVVVKSNSSSLTQIVNQLFYFLQNWYGLLVG